MTKLVLKWSKWLSLSFVGLLLTLIVGVSFLLFTHPGLGVILWGAEKFVPQLKVDSYQGSLLPRFTLNELQFNDTDLGIETHARSVTLAVNPACFTEPGICVDDVAIDGLRFAMPEAPASSEPSEEETSSGKITTPVPIKVHRVALTDIDLDILGNRIDWQTFTTGFFFQGNNLRLSKTALQQINVELAESEEAAPEPVSTAAPTTIELPDIELPLQIEVVRLDVNEFRLKQATPVIVNHLGLQAKAAGSEVTISTLELEMPEVEAQLESQITLNQGYPLDLKLQATVKEETANGQTLQLTASGSVADLNLNAELGGLAKATLQAQLQPLEPELPFDIKLQKGDVQWPLHGKGDYFVAIDHLESKGSLDGYSVDLTTKIKGKDLPDLDLRVDGKGTLEQIDLASIQLNTLGGSVSGDVMANWKEPINWAANLSLSHIQPGLQWPDAEGDISGVVSTTGSLTEAGGWKVAVSKLDIDGILREYPLNIEGQLNASDVKGNGNLRFDTDGLVLSHGPNNVHAKGKLTDEWRMHLSLDLPQLAKSVPDLNGKAIGDVVLRGPLKEPRVKLALDVDSLDWKQQATVKHVTLKGNVTPLPAPSGDLELKISDATYQDHVIDEVSLVFNGTQKAHQLTLDVVSNIASTSLALAGSLVDKPDISWNGALERMSISSEQGEWTLDHSTPIGFEMATQQVSVAAHCWLQADSSLCLNENIKVGESGEASLSVKQFNFDQIKAFVPEATELKGEANADVWAKWDGANSPEVKASVELPSGQVTQKLDQPLQVGWESIKLNAVLKQDRLDADWLIDVRDNGDISGKATIPNVLVDDKQIDGKLQLSTFTLDFLSPLLGEYNELKSSITTDLAFSGPVMQPKVDGQFVIDDMRLQGQISPVQVDSGRLTIDFSGYQAQLKAGLNTPDGTLKLTGDADWHNLEEWSTKLRVFASELKVEVPPMVDIKVVPDMTISATPKFAKIEGDIGLPWGRIVVEELPPSAIGISKDQVILNEQLQPEESMSSIPFAVETNINISIGDDFKLSAFGLEGGLKGNLNVAQRDKGPFITGEINIVDGSYQSFGQDLVIEQGKILMNGPVDQPYVQITAIRNPDNTQDDVTAGVKVTGPATEPIVTIFSDPAMPQANALSYLLRGQDIDGESGGNAMTTTLIGLSLAQSGRVVGEIGEAFGVQDLQLDTAGSGEDSQVTVSGYVLPGLQVKYGVGIFDSVGEFTVRYRLMKDLYVETVTGVSSAVDLLYQFEFN
ncbi:autotransporter assembly complex protein TamB [Vibrio atypicus]|uniref:autotransporter assembly complex protein TamB n=1 Tax=Vibrio atypicus TaxID=558271 RepID=UPI003735BEDB